MSSQTTTHEQTADLPSFPGEREARCPFDPPPAHTDWREGEGLQRTTWHGSPVWAVTRYEDIRQVLSDQRISADFRTPGFPGWTPAAENEPPIFPRMDDPEHARLRRMLTKDFTVKRVEQKREQIQGLVDDYLERMIAKGQSADLVHEFALPVPSLVISVMLGVPYSDHAFFQEHSDTVNNASASEREKAAAKGALFGYLLELVGRKEKEPGDDIISRLLHEEVATGELTREAVAMNGIILLIAGHETTANMIALSTLALLQNPDQAARLRETDDPKVIANTVEELLRYLTIAQDMVVRMATEDITIGGQLVRAGEGLIVGLPSGNRDATVFERAEDFDIDRRNARMHVGFGYGIHQCLGQALARLELQIALPTLLRRLPDLRLAVPLEDVKFRHGMSTYGVHELPVAW
ncbi:cytochrome P450 [Nocardiopsis synnemataformans]|uniref:cytochrome P450 n=1 Tax=Nocardiopsis synnemataformans TaxID=61305 RepID=UPI003EBBBC46